MEALKKCHTCGEDKPIENFRWLKARRPSDPARWRANECSSCFRARYRAYNKLPRVRIRHMVHDMNKNAKKRMFDCNITAEDIFQMYDDQDGKCAITGFDMTLGSSDDLIEKQYAASPDRIDNERGYTTDNVWLVTARANSLKSDMTIEELLEWCTAVVKNHDIKL